MSQIISTFQHSTPSSRLQSAIASLKRGGAVLLLDDEDRENEGDLIYSTDFLTEQQMAFMIRHCSGIVCLCLQDEDINRLGLRPMVKNNTSAYQTAFTVSIEAKDGVTTGVSAKDRLTTIKAAVNTQNNHENICSPGHVFPLRANPGGVLARRGHTEGTINLMQLAGLSPSGVLCELTNDDGTMAKTPDVVRFAELHAIPVLTIDDIVSHLSMQKAS
ncbi:3,4-dihydroxy-2-butanone-4-phosphate synthase [Neptunicella marina]|uniref:3,4-dihydroxy-2-butanone 4-phosphate synthase n=1 Tax=Neptunicella marina TaxID=2125989 RepID=A0A8J6IXH1_9ALTE|nr:3,4-dihydroxy-2-butanone-4-phosphate synthase [Neptunicella marina]MBC3767734.1 3,4-dihydroxy-2-butanone-4-phosphate synthase [Neptunicella marina]